VAIHIRFAAIVQEENEMSRSCATRCAVNSGQALIVTQAGFESLTLRTLAKKAIRMLIYPSAFSQLDREEVAETMSKAIGLAVDDVFAADQ
jgi:hypothetical protein